MILITILFIIVLDQFTKYLIVTHLPLWQEIPALGKVMSITHVRNTGAAFSILRNQTMFFIVVSIIVLVALIWFRNKIELTKWWHKVGYGLLIGGAIGNLIDRIRWGYVVDFIDFHFWPVFNVADMAVVSAACLLIIYVIQDMRRGETTNG